MRHGDTFVLTRKRTAEEVASTDDAGGFEEPETYVVTNPPEETPQAIIRARKLDNRTAILSSEEYFFHLHTLMERLEHDSTGDGGTD